MVALHARTTLNPQPITPLQESAARWQSMPDSRYIQKQVSVVMLARELGLDVVSKSNARCWRIENHQNADASPSIGFTRRNTWMCNVCDERCRSNIELVMQVRDYGFAEAVRWIASLVPVPSIPKGRHSGPRQANHLRSRVGVSASPVMYMLIHSGLWAELPSAERALLPVLVEFTDPETGLVTLSYAEMMFYSGIGKRAAISGALKNLERLHLVEHVTMHRREGAIKPIGTYRVTDDDPALQKMLADMRRQRNAQAAYRRSAARAAREERKRVTERKRRTAARTPAPYPVPTPTKNNTNPEAKGTASHLKVIHSSPVGTDVRFLGSHVGTGKLTTRTKTKDLQVSVFEHESPCESVFGD